MPNGDDTTITRIFDRMDDGFDRLQAAVGGVKDDVSELDGRLIRVETRMESLPTTDQVRAITGECLDTHVATLHKVRSVAPPADLAPVWAGASDDRVNQVDNPRHHYGW